jgi:hypothetical protein
MWRMPTKNPSETRWAAQPRLSPRSCPK